MINVETTSRALQYILAPVVMISASALVLNGMQSRYTTIGAQMRDMAQERLKLISAKTKPLEYEKERLYDIDLELPRLLHHHFKLHQSMMVMYMAIMLFVINMFAIAVAYVIDSSLTASVSIVVFLMATFMLFFGLVMNAHEFRTSHLTTQYEVRRILSR